MQASNQRATAKTTNLNFKWYKTPTARKETPSELRSSASRLPKHPNLAEGRSKVSYLLSFLENGLKRYPQVRPSICTVITGAILLICAILTITVPLFRDATIPWVNLLVLGCACCVIVGGFVGVVVHSRRILSALKRERTVLVPMADLRKAQTENPKKFSKLPPAGSMETVLEEQHTDLKAGHATSVPAPRLDLDCESVSRKLLANKHRRRKLPGSPVYSNCAVSSGVYHQKCKLPTVENKHTDAEICVRSNSTSSRPARISKHLGCYYSSEPDLVGSASQWSERNPLAVALPSESEHLKHYTPGDYLDQQDRNKRRRAPKNIRLTRNEACCPRAVIDVETANEIFDVYHDPLLYKAITRLNYQCDFEFISVSRK